MHPEVHRDALLAAARIACASSLVACQKAPPPVAAESVPAAPVPAETVPAQIGPAESDLTPALPTRDEVATCGALTEEAFAQLQALTEAANTAGGKDLFAKVEAARTAALTEEVVDCCHSLAVHHSFPRGLDGPKNVDLFDEECCAAVEYAYPACTPWGPPAPPRMPALA